MDELVKDLRENHDKYFARDKQAADAIEEMSADCDMYRKGMTDEHNKAARLLWDKEHCWIPVTERLPDVFKHVLVNIPGMAPNPTVQEAFRETNGMWYSNGFRYKADDITHWMPLPSTEGLNET